MPERVTQPEKWGVERHPDTSLEDLRQVEAGETLEALQDKARRGRLDAPLDVLQARERRLHTRRGFLGIAWRAAALTGVAAGTGIEALRFDTRLGEIINPSTNLSLERVAPAASPEYARSDTLLIPGFNVYSARPAAEAIRKSLTKRGSVTALQHASGRFSIDDLTQATRAHIEDHQLNSLTLLGSSLGGMIAVDLASRIPEVNLVIVDSSPADPSDALGLPEGFFKEVVENASWVMDTLDMSGGPGARTTIEFIKRLHDGDKSALRCLKEALEQDYTRSCPNPLVLDLFTYLITHNIQSHADNKAHFDLLYMGVDDAARDTIVNQRSAVEKYKAFAESQEVLFAHATSDQTAHADIAAKGKAYSMLYEEGVGAIESLERVRIRSSFGTMGYRIIGR